MARGLASRGHGALLLGWRYVPLWARRIAIRVLFPLYPVGSAAVIRDDQGRVLLVRQTYHRGERWGVPGGWIRRGETPRQAAARETFEELGVQVTVGRVLAADMGLYGEVTLAFDCRLADTGVLTFSGEIDRAEYFALDSLPAVPKTTRKLLAEALAPP